ncbi:hypothetical protein AAEX28_06570 [Lentisphaerota bacterium WC36G]|nr:hypothetical protein LJT99_09435 [Lentisphaerae bacterium WC36]
MNDDIWQLITSNRAVKNALSRNAKLNKHVQFYLHENYKKLDKDVGSNCMVALSAFLFPALLAYLNICTVSDDLFPPLFGQRPSEDIDDCIITACKAMEKYIPDLIEGTHRGVYRESQAFVSQFIDEKAQTALQRNHGNMRSFWVLAAFYYQSELAYLEAFVPRVGNHFQLTKFSLAEFKLLEQSCDDKINAFKQKHRILNDITQTHSKENLAENPYQSGDGVIISPADLAARCHFQLELANHLARDFYGFSMAIESWENLLFFDSHSGCLEYLPLEIASAKFIQNVYNSVFSHISSSSEANLLPRVKMNILMYIANHHIFLRAIYKKNRSNNRKCTTSFKHYALLKEKFNEPSSCSTR